MVLCSHIKKKHVSVLELSIIRSPRMTIMKDSPIRPRGTNRGVSEITTTPPRIGTMMKQTLQFILIHSGFGCLHNVKMSLAANMVDMTHHFYFFFSFNNTTLAKFIPQTPMVNPMFIHSLIVSRSHDFSTVSILSPKSVNNTRRSFVDVVFQLVNIVYLFNSIFFANLITTGNLSHPNCVSRRESGHEENTLPFINMQRSIKSSLIHPKQVVKVAFLTKQCLNVSVISCTLLCSLKEKN
mmetsp:Transcript_19797/g.30992  ORF Transcript_19797/g.30992 Transcript_19797/m.30992 type:complete len:239 (-) Transcript_19797:114-830(-)